MADINDKVLMQSIHSTIRQVLEGYLGRIDKDDVWLDREGVYAQFRLTPSWLNRYGQFLDRVKPEGSAYLYSRNSLAKMYKNGDIENISSKKNNN